ncbi:MAG: hypothetical protein IT373_15460, partial [Polyangiaceae bacterium]|nr:hypothetical protein [Polyangiaceae bacterium]
MKAPPTRHARACYGYGMRARAWPIAVLVVLSCRPRATVPRDPARPERDDDGSEPSDAERLRRRVTERLGVIEALLEPACGTRCGSVAALPGDELDTGAQCEPAPAGRASIIRYRPEVLLAAL